MTKVTGKYNILLVHNNYQIPGGEDIVVANEKKMLEKYGYKVILYSRHNRDIHGMNWFQKFFFPISLIFNLKTYRDIKRIIKTNDINIVHVHNTLHLISPAVYYAAVSCGVPVVQTMHNFRFLCPGATFYRDGHICEDCVSDGLLCSIKAKCYRNSRVETILCAINTWIHRHTGILGKINFICLTDFNKEKLLLLDKIDINRVFVKPNFVDSERVIIPGSKRKCQFVFAGRLDQLKGIDILLYSWKKMGKDAPKLIVCGTGPMEEWCQQFVKANNLCNVELKGFVSNQEVKNIIANSKALILPTQWYEGFPMTIVESYSVGTPVICSDLGNCSCVVNNGLTGWKFKSVEQLTEIIANYRDISESTYENFCCQYSEKKNIELLQKIYDKCTEIQSVN